MSLSVDPITLARANQGMLSSSDFVALIARSLPLAWHIIEDLKRALSQSSEGVAEFCPPTLDDHTRGQLLRLCASTAMRTAVEEHCTIATGTPVRIGFQNCHRLALFDTTHSTKAYERFTSMEAQVLAQRPEMVDC